MTTPVHLTRTGNLKMVVVNLDISLSTYSHLGPHFLVVVEAVIVDVVKANMKARFRKEEDTTVPKVVT